MGSFFILKRRSIKNMNEFEDLINKNINEAESILGAEFVYKGKTYKGFYNQITEMQELQDGGFLQTIKTTMSVQKTALYNITFEKGKFINFKNKNYRINEIDDEEFFITLELLDPKK